MDKCEPADILITKTEAKYFYELVTMDKGFAYTPRYKEYVKNKLLLALVGKIPNKKRRKRLSDKYDAKERKSTANHARVYKRPTLNFGQPRNAISISPNTDTP